MNITTDEVYTLYHKIWDLRDPQTKTWANPKPSINFDFAAHLKAEKVLEEEAYAMDDKAGKGLNIGRILQFPIADGYAIYMVVGIKPKTVIAVHLPFGDAYMAGNIVNPDTGSLSRRVAEQNIKRNDGMKELFAPSTI